MDRRNFLKGLIGTAAGASFCNLLTPRFALASGIENNKHLVVVSLRGGLDALWSVGHIGSYASTIQTLRGDLAVAEEDVLEIIPGTLGLNSNGWAPLAPYMTNMKLISGVGFGTEHSCSHNDAQLAFASLGNLADHTGWIGRLRQEYPDFVNGYNTYGFRTGNSPEFQPLGETPPVLLDVLSQFGYLNGPYSSGEANAQRNITRMLLNLPVGEDAGNMATSTYSSMATIEEAIGVMQNIASVPTSGNYGSGYFASSFEDATKVIIKKKLEADNTNTLIAIDVVGFDSHDDQANALPPLLTNTTQAIRGMIDDLIAQNLWADTTIVILSEFGRTTQRNQSGTDHGKGNYSYLFSGSINQPVSESTVVGTLPTIPELVHPRNLLIGEIRPQNIIHEALEWWGVNPDPVLGEFPRVPLGLLS